MKPRPGACRRSARRFRAFLPAERPRAFRDLLAARRYPVTPPGARRHAGDAFVAVPRVVAQDREPPARDEVCGVLGRAHGRVLAGLDGGERAARRPPDGERVRVPRRLVRAAARGAPARPEELRALPPRERLAWLQPAERPERDVAAGRERGLRSARAALGTAGSLVEKAPAPAGVAATRSTARVPGSPRNATRHSGVERVSSVPAGMLCPTRPIVHAAALVRGDQAKHPPRHDPCRPRGGRARPAARRRPRSGSGGRCRAWPPRARRAALRRAPPCCREEPRAARGSAEHDGPGVTRPPRHATIGLER